MLNVRCKLTVSKIRFCCVVKVLCSDVYVSIYCYSHFPQLIKFKKNFCSTDSSVNWKMFDLFSFAPATQFLELCCVLYRKCSTAWRYCDAKNLCWSLYYFECSGTMYFVVVVYRCLCTASFVFCWMYDKIWQNSLWKFLFFFILVLVLFFFTFIRHFLFLIFTTRLIDECQCCYDWWFFYS